jgi:hypothetical protein
MLAFLAAIAFGSIVDDLSRLASLYKQELLSAEEFALAKSRLLHPEPSSIKKDQSALEFLLGQGLLSAEEYAQTIAQLPQSLQRKQNVTKFGGFVRTELNCSMYPCMCDNTCYSELGIGVGNSREKKLSLFDLNYTVDGLRVDPDKVINESKKSYNSNAIYLDLDPNTKPAPMVLWDLRDLPLPFPDNSFDEIHAYEVLVRNMPFKKRCSCHLPAHPPLHSSALSPHPIPPAFIFSGAHRPTRRLEIFPGAVSRILASAAPRRLFLRIESSY